MAEDITTKKRGRKKKEESVIQTLPPAENSRMSQRAHQIAEETKNATKEDIDKAWEEWKSAVRA